MKLISFFAFALLFIFTSCSDKKIPNNETTKKRDQPNLEEVSTPVASPKTESSSTRKASSPEELEKAKSIIANVSKEDLAAVDGKKVFKSYCAICHGFTGDLNVNNATDLTTSTLPLVERVAQVYHGRGLMTPFKSLLKDEEIVAVGKYLETLKK